MLWYTVLIIWRTNKQIIRGLSNQKKQMIRDEKSQMKQNEKKIKVLLATKMERGSSLHVRLPSTCFCRNDFDHTRLCPVGEDKDWAYAIIIHMQTCFIIVQNDEKLEEIKKRDQTEQ